MNVLISGSLGQLGWELQQSKPDTVSIEAVDVGELDITREADVQSYVANARPDIIINAAAFTAVDRAEEESDLAFLINETGARNLALAARSVSARMIQISTDFVFDGIKSSPYEVNDAANPISVYGASKLAGEKAVLESGVEANIVRTAWLYSTHGNNFVKTMLRLMSERDNLEVVADQIGSPTWARGLAQAIWRIVERRPDASILHWSDAGVASWYDFAQAIYEEANALDLLDREVTIKPLRTEDYPTAAARPSYSVMETTNSRAILNLKGLHWRQALREMLSDLKEMPGT